MVTRSKRGLDHPLRPGAFSLFIEVTAPIIASRLTGEPAVGRVFPLKGFLGPIGCFSRSIVSVLALLGAKGAVLYRAFAARPR